jgi:hypothetical protein
VERDRLFLPGGSLAMTAWKQRNKMRLTQQVIHDLLLSELFRNSALCAICCK